MIEKLQSILNGTWSPQPGELATVLALCVFMIVLSLTEAFRDTNYLRKRLRQSPQSGKRRSTSELHADPRSLAAAEERQLLKIMERAGRLVVTGSEKERITLRRQLVQAGFLSASALPIYYAIRVVSALVLPVLVILAAELYQLPNRGSIMLWLAIGGTVAGYIIPSTLLDWQSVRMRGIYRNAFPDMLDLLVVCVEAGQGLHGAIERVGREIALQCPSLGANMHIVSLELRAGKSLTNALEALHERLGIDEVKSFALLLKQSEELGVGITNTLRVFSDEMRDKRLMRAEARANALPVKMTIPLALFIFPVVLMVIMTPIVIRISTLFH